MTNDAHTLPAALTRRPLTIPTTSTTTTTCRLTIAMHVEYFTGGVEIDVRCPCGEIKPCDSGDAAAEYLRNHLTRCLFVPDRYRKGLAP